MANSALPDSIVEAISISNAKAICEQPAILANMQLANQVLNNNMAQQAMIRQQEVLSQLSAAAVAKSVAVILGTPTDPSGDSALQMAKLVELIGNMSGPQLPPPEPLIPPDDICPEPIGPVPAPPSGTAKKKGKKKDKKKNT